MLANHKYTNQLIHESSPYLLQHAHNPVQWYPWGRQALEKAQAENKIILVSIGYSACHWCHVMERESFEDEATAEIMNRHFINIKIDREERPDIDHIYMDAVQAMSGSGGWPLNVFLTPDTRPFYGGTYFPPAPAYNRPSWKEVLHSVAHAWAERRHEIEAQAENVTAYLRQSNSIAQPKFNLVQSETASPFTVGLCKNICEAILKTADTQWGGFGRAPKFPQTFTIRYLLQYYYHSGYDAALQQALLSIDKMLDGGIYDHVGGGMARYSTDYEWLAPHFEKMLYDNALLITVLCDAFQLTRNEKYAKAIHKTIGFVQEELLNKEGGYYAALDADSEGEEGKYYVWQKEEIEKILGPEAPIFCRFFDISNNGNWEGKNILRILQPTDLFVKENGLDATAFETTIQQCLLQLKAARKNRIKPGLDDKSILAWNALMLEAVAKAAVVLQHEGYRQLAIRNFEFIEKQLAVEAGSTALQHTWKNGRAQYPAFLDDYAFLIAASLAMYEAVFDVQYLYKAKNWCQYVIDNFSDEEQIFFYYTSSAQDDVIVRKKEIYDGAIPSGNAVMAACLSKLSVIFENDTWRQRARIMLEHILPLATKYPGSFGNWCVLVLQETCGINEIAVTGTDAVQSAEAVLAQYIPSRVLMAETPAAKAFALLRDKPETKQPVFYLCSNYACLAPTYSVKTLYEAIVKKDKI
jgi:uncharacterized protein